MATVILLRVLATHTLVLATSTEHSLVVQVYAMELDRAITATTLLALVTRIVEPAISTESTSVIMTGITSSDDYCYYDHDDNDNDYDTND